MILKFSKTAEDSYKKLPLNIQKKADRQFNYLLSNYRHPSLRTGKMGEGNIYEGRIDIHYRFSFQVIGEEIYILIIGSHDVGLGKK